MGAKVEGVVQVDVVLAAAGVVEEGVSVAGRDRDWCDSHGQRVTVFSS